jgi:hypothetical protein
MAKSYTRTSDLHLGDNIKIDHKRIYFGGTYYIERAQDRIQWRFESVTSIAISSLSLRIKLSVESILNVAKMLQNRQKLLEEFIKFFRHVDGFLLYSERIRLLGTWM